MHVALERDPDPDPDPDRKSSGLENILSMRFKHMR